MTNRACQHPRTYLVARTQNPGNTTNKPQTSTPHHHNLSQHHNHNFLRVRSVRSTIPLPATVTRPITHHRPSSPATETDTIDLGQARQPPFTVLDIVYHTPIKRLWTKSPHIMVNVSSTFIEATRLPLACLSLKHHLKQTRSLARSSTGITRLQSFQQQSQGLA
jgi:hypothetical protein